eukprot:4956417-Pleurochrysis_carterae.AAC.1
MGVAVAQQRVIDAPAENVERQNAQRKAAKHVQSAIQVCRAIQAGYPSRSFVQVKRMMRVAHSM